MFQNAYVKTHDIVNVFKHDDLSIMFLNIMFLKHDMTYENMMFWKHNVLEASCFVNIMF